MPELWKQTEEDITFITGLIETFWETQQMGLPNCQMWSHPLLAVINLRLKTLILQKGGNQVWPKKASASTPILSQGMVNAARSKSNNAMVTRKITHVTKRIIHAIKKITNATRRAIIAIIRKSHAVRTGNHAIRISARRKIADTWLVGKQLTWTHSSYPRECCSCHLSLRVQNGFCSTVCINSPVFGTKAHKLTSLIPANTCGKCLDSCSRWLLLAKNST